MGYESFEVLFDPNENCNVYRWNKNNEDIFFANHVFKKKLL